MIPSVKTLSVECNLGESPRFPSGYCEVEKTGLLSVTIVAFAGVV